MRPLPDKVCEVCCERDIDPKTDMLLCTPCARSYRRRGDLEDWQWAARRARREERARKQVGAEDLRQLRGRTQRAYVR